MDHQFRWRTRPGRDRGVHVLSWNKPAERRSTSFGSEPVLIAPDRCDFAGAIDNQLLKSRHCFAAPLDKDPCSMDNSGSRLWRMVLNLVHACLNVIEASALANQGVSAGTHHQGPHDGIGAVSSKLVSGVEAGAESASVSP